MTNRENQSSACNKLTPWMPAKMLPGDSNPGVDGRRSRSGRSMIGLVIFLAGFTVLLLIVSHFYLLPALEVTDKAKGVEKQGLTAWSRLLLAILLMVLV